MFCSFRRRSLVMESEVWKKVNFAKVRGIRKKREGLR